MTSPGRGLGNAPRSIVGRPYPGRQGPSAGNARAYRRPEGHFDEVEVAGTGDDRIDWADEVIPKGVRTSHESLVATVVRLGTNA